MLTHLVYHSTAADCAAYVEWGVAFVVCFEFTETKGPGKFRVLFDFIEEREKGAFEGCDILEGLNSQDDFWKLEKLMFLKGRLLGHFILN